MCSAETATAECEELLSLNNMHHLKDYAHLIGHLEGFNADLIEEHIKLYEGYVKKHNEINEKLGGVEKTGNYSYAEHSELVRRRSVAWNGTKLHELYFDNLTPGGTELGSGLVSLLERGFGSVTAWKDDLKACAAATPGWVLLAQNLDEGTLRHYVVYEHHNNYPAEVRVIMALDCWEHAFAKQYGTNKVAYLDAFLKNLHGEELERRLV